MHEIRSSVSYFVTSDTSLSYTAYLNMLHTWFFPQLCEVSRQLLCEKWYTPHYAFPVRDQFMSQSVDDGLNVDLILCGQLEVHT
jgi:hypothetical protein